MLRRAGHTYGGAAGGPPDETPPNQALLDMRAQLAALHNDMWGRRN